MTFFHYIFVRYCSNATLFYDGYWWISCRYSEELRGNISWHAKHKGRYWLLTINSDEWGHDIYRIFFELFFGKSFIFGMWAFEQKCRENETWLAEMSHKAWMHLFTFHPLTRYRITRDSRIILGWCLNSNCPFYLS